MWHVSYNFRLAKGTIATMDIEEQSFRSSDDAEQAALYSSNRMETEAANQHLIRSAKDPEADRQVIANRARMVLGFTPEMRNASTTDEVIAALYRLRHQYASLTKVWHVTAYLRTLWYLRRLRKK